MTRSEVKRARPHRSAAPGAPHLALLLVVLTLGGAVAATGVTAQTVEPAAAEPAAAEPAAAEPAAAEPAPTPGRPSREIRLQTTSVSGNRELPRVMVVVPWKSAAPARLGDRPIVSLVEEALTPIDPDVFRRELEYFGLLHGGVGEDARESVKTANILTED